MPSKELLDLCADHGLMGEDALTAIRSYVATGPLTPDEIEDLRTAFHEVRHTNLAARYGSDGARVAAIVVATP